MVPSKLTGHWSLYIWDMELRTIHMLDPSMGGTSSTTQRDLHREIIADLNDAMLFWTEEFFEGWTVSFKEYKATYYKHGHRNYRRLGALN